MWKETVLAYYPAIRLDGLRKTKENLGQDSPGVLAEIQAEYLTNTNRNPYLSTKTFCIYVLRNVLHNCDSYLLVDRLIETQIGL
jgi:hypothetical protein